VACDVCELGDWIFRFATVLYNWRSFSFANLFHSSTSHPLRYPVWLTVEGSIKFMVPYPHSSVPNIKRTINIDTLQVWWIRISVSYDFLRLNDQAINSSGTWWLMMEGQTVLLSGTLVIEKEHIWDWWICSILLGATQCSAGWQ